MPPAPSDAPSRRPAPEPPVFPRGSGELGTAIAHYYRGELARMTSWRDRLDRTTNWAIAGSAAMLSVALSNADSHHGVLLAGMALVALLLTIESRRYRFFHSYRNRVRLIERNYFAEVFSRREPADPTPWMRQLADDLRAPVFSISLVDAMTNRLRRNYAWLFVLLLCAWILKITTRHLQPRGSVEAMRPTRWLIENASLGVLPGWFVVAAVAVFYVAIVALLVRSRPDAGELCYGEVHV
ncbi:MAG: DUF2270 domain-containing protein [Anaeromyxobacteraceae bacterium]